MLTQQDDDGTEYMVAAISRSLNVHERVYSPYQGELLAVVWAVRTFHLYLHGAEFTLFTDHQPLQWLFSRQDLSGQSARWVLLLQEYDFKVIHRPGKSNGNADALSRLPLEAQDQVPLHPPLAAVLPNTATLADTLPMVDNAMQAAAQQLPPPSLQLPPSLQPPAGTKPAHQLFHHQAHQHGLVLVDLCGGLATTVDAVLRLGYTVRAYAYADVDAEARWAAYHRLQQLAVAYPGQLHLQLPSTFLNHLPQDVTDIRPAHLDQLMSAHPGVPLLFVCGWPCQDLSPAGTQHGLQGARSSLIHHVLPLLHHCIQANRTTVGYVLENAATQHNFRSEHIRTQVTADLQSMLGDAVTLDAAQCGSYAHRLRNFWTNLAPTAQLAVVTSHLNPPSRPVQSILDAGRSVQVAQTTDQHPYYASNVAGQPVATLPTLVSHPHSHSFRDGRQGMLRTATGALEQPNVEERERAMGLPTGATAAPGLSQAARHSLTGRSIDMHCLVMLLHVTAALSVVSGWSRPASASPLASA